MADEFLTPLLTQADELARRLRQWNERFLEVKLAQERRTIDVRVEQESDTKAIEIATQLLQKNQEWNQTEQLRLQLLERRSEETRKWFKWFFGMIRRSANTWMFFIAWTTVIAAWGWVGGINTPLSITCPNRASLCFSARFWGEKKAKSDGKKPLCTKTRIGLMCLVEPAPKKNLKAGSGSQKQK